jgi:hypothetical protein
VIKQRCCCKVNFDYKSTKHWGRKVYYKIYSFCRPNRYNMLQRQIVKSLGKQIDIEDPGGKKYVITSFHSITWMLISVNVTIHMTVPILQRYQNSSHCIPTAEPRSSI